jgi:ubiquinone/menaquinone biosynthesis C-methylase UbiE
LDLVPYDDLCGPEWEIWKRLQENGAYVYEAAPENNLAVNERWDAVAFRKFCNMSGAVLDVGCGVQGYPSYADKKQVDLFIGVDPLAGRTARGYPFVQALGEFLPFPNRTFDHCLFATTLDHFVSAQKGLAEAARITKLGGAVHVWHGCMYPNAADPAPVLRQIRFLASTYWRRAKEMAGAREYGAIVRKAVERTGLISRKSDPAASTAALRMLDVPNGAEDAFHMRHFSEADLYQWIEQSGLVIDKGKRIPSSYVSYNLFLTLRAR